MRLLVVGGAGFIGSSLVDRLLAEGHAVDVVDDLSSGSLANLADARADRSNDVTFHRVDVAEPVAVELIARRAPEVVFHLAGLPAGGDLAPLLDALHEAGVAKVVVALAASDLYEAAPVDDGLRREGEVTTDTPGTISGVPDAARVALAALATARATRSLEYTALALATVYGPRQVPTAPVARSLAGEPVDDEALDLVFVDDVVDAVVRAATRGSGLLINVGTGVATAVASLAAEGGPQPGTGRGVVLDPGRAGMQLGWAPWTTVADGVAATRPEAEPPPT